MKLDYKGYEAIVAYDETARLYHGEVTNIRDVVTFQGRSEEEARLALAESIDDYVEFCGSRGEPPEKPALTSLPRL